jgi:hypothetical protein
LSRSIKYMGSRAAFLSPSKGSDWKRSLSKCWPGTGASGTSYELLIHQAQKLIHWHETPVPPLLSAQAT